MPRSKSCRACGQKVEPEREHVRVQFKPCTRLVTFHRKCFDIRRSVYYRITYVSNAEPLVLMESDA